MAVVLAECASRYAKRQYKLLGEIDTETEEPIRKIYHKLRAGKLTANKIGEIGQIRKKIKKGEPKVDLDSTVDLFIKIDDEENYFDITTVKPSKKEFAALKLKLLRWTALRLSQDKDAKVFTRLAILYNPFNIHRL